MREYRRKADANQSAIVRALRKAGAVVDDVHALPTIGYDLIVQRGDEIWKVECKNKDGKGTKLTDNEERAKALAGRRYLIVVDPVDAVQQVFCSAM